MSDQPSAVVDPNAAADAFLASLGGIEGVAVDAPDPIGGYVSPPLDLASDYPAIREQLASTSAPQSTVYYDGDEYVYLEAMPLEYRVRLQDQLVALGLASNVLRGEIDNATVSGMAKLMALANRSGSTWQGTLSRLTKMQDDGLLDGANVPEIDPYRPPDYATLAQTVKQTVRQSLGREPTQAELRLMTDELAGDYREQYDAGLAVAEDQGAGREVSAPQVDPISRFREAFDARYAGEMKQIDTEQSVMAAAQDAQSQAANVGRIVG